MIHVCIPAHDEERTVGLLLWKIRSEMIEFGRDFEIVVWDDASTDGTAEVLERYRQVLPLRVVRSESRVGYSAAIEGLLRDVTPRASYPKRDVIVTLQGDFSEDPRDIVSLVKAVEGGADLVTATSVWEGDGPPRAVRWARWWAPRVMGRSWRDSPVTDPSVGFRAFRAIVLRKLLQECGDRPLMSRDGWAANVELLASAAPLARRVEEIEVTPRTGVKQRETRFRLLRTVRDLARLRGEARWAEVGSRS